MKQANIVWDAKTLDAYLTDPQKLVPGNKMPFPGLETEQDRADVIAFIATSNSGAATAAGTPSGGAAPKRSMNFVLHRPLARISNRRRRVPAASPGAGATRRRAAKPPVAGQQGVPALARGVLLPGSSRSARADPHQRAVDFEHGTAV